jgi:hypothetical protein
MLAGLTVTVVPVNELVAVRVTVPAKPFRLVTLRVDVTVEPGVVVTLLGFALKMKSVVVLDEKTAV